MATLESLRVLPPPQWGEHSAVGAAGSPCSAEDEAMLQLVPHRPYFAGEVVAVEAAHVGCADDGGSGGVGSSLIYAEVDAATSSSSGAASIALRMGSGGAVVQCLPLRIHSFRSQRGARQASPVDADRHRDVGAAASRGGAYSGEGSGGGRGGGGGGGMGGGGPSSGDLVDAVSSVLRRAGVPISLETEQLLSANLKLQHELAQARADLEDANLEASRAKDTLETTERQVTCQVCMQRRVDVLLNGCGHMLCGNCASQIRERCPFCRGGLEAGTTRVRW